jgi:selenium metabolism protein YedF
VILTRKALAEGGFDLLELIVDDASSRENVVRFAGFVNCAIEEVLEEGAESRILIRPGTPAAPSTARVFADPAPAPSRARPAGPGSPCDTVFISSAGIGTGDESLAALLMRGFLYTLTEGESLPGRIILMNGGVRLAVEGSDSLVNLRRLADRGVEILACGTCLEFYQLKDSLGVGRISNLYEIAGLLTQGRTLSL